MLGSVIKFMFDNIGNLCSSTNISNLMTSAGRKISVHTVESYLKSLLECFVLYKAERYDIKGKQYLSSGYRIHPAFEDGSRKGKNNNYMNGEWDSELAGIWVAKFEASREDSTVSTQGSSSIIKIQPDTKSWVNITIGDSYTNSLDMYTKYNSHLMKNSEWGAVRIFNTKQVWKKWNRSNNKC